MHTEEGGRVSYKPYQKTSRDFFAVLDAFEGLRTVEKASIDEAYVELSPTADGAPTIGQGHAMALALKAAVLEQVCVPVATQLGERVGRKGSEGRSCVPDPTGTGRALAGTTKSFLRALMGRNMRRNGSFGRGVCVGGCSEERGSNGP